MKLPKPQKSEFMFESLLFTHSCILDFWEVFPGNANKLLTIDEVNSMIASYIVEVE